MTANSHIKLLCDYDGAIPRRYMERIEMVTRFVRVRVRVVRIDRTRHGYHVVIHASGRVSAVRRIALQALLGSDWKRETFNLRRATVRRAVPAVWRDRGNVLYAAHYRRLTTDATE